MDKTGVSGTSDPGSIPGRATAAKPIGAPMGFYFYDSVIEHIRLFIRKTSSSVVFEVINNLTGIFSITFIESDAALA